jgi:hypothetical protein
MKKLLVVGLLVIATASAFAQGLVSFNNNGIVTGNPDSIAVFFGDQAAGGHRLTLGDGAYVAQLWYGPAGSSESALTALTDPPTAFRAATTTLPGTWANGGNKTLPGIAESATAVLQVRVWDTTKGQTYDAAKTAFNGNYTGKSALFNYVAPPAGSPPAAYNMANFTGFFVARSCTGHAKVQSPCKSAGNPQTPTTSVSL